MMTMRMGMLYLSLPLLAGCWTAVRSETSPQRNMLRVTGVFNSQEGPRRTCFIRSSTGETKPLQRYAMMQEGDVLLLGAKDQALGRFSDGAALCMGPSTEMKMIQRKQTGDYETHTQLELRRGSLRVNMSRTSSRVTIHLPDVKPGPVTITGQASHFQICLDDQSGKVELQVQAWDGECKVELPSGHVAQGNGSTKVFTVEAGMVERVALGNKNSKEPVSDNPGYLAYPAPKKMR